jgi:hypothetical protein
MASIVEPALLGAGQGGKGTEMRPTPNAQRPTRGHAARPISLALLLAGMAASVARADLVENQVLLLWNSQDSESQDIRDAYKAKYPGVVECDLNLEYPSSTYHLTDIQPDGCGITSKYITPCRFKQMFVDGPSVFTACLSANPQVYAIVTTRGLPAAISDTLMPAPFDNDVEQTCCSFGCQQQPFCVQPGGGMYASFEAALSRRGLGPLGEGDAADAYDAVLNPYYPGTTVGELDDFESIFDYEDCEIPLEHEPDPLCPGEAFIVCRLDSALPENIPQNDADGDGDVDYVDGVVAMLRGSTYPVNKYATTALFDTSPQPSPPDLSIDPEDYLNTAVALWLDRWCFAYDQSLNFIHGPDDPDADETDAAFTAYDLICLQSWGQHHQQPGQVDAGYAGYYNAHPAGVFLSFESYNGWSLHKPGTHPFQHGQVLDWIASGGGFSIGYVQEPTLLTIADLHVVFKNFFVRGMTWGEASTGSLPYLGSYATPVGDPLAKITGYDPDITGPNGEPDRIVNQLDRNLVTAQFGQTGPGLQADINQDQIVNAADRTLVSEAFGRNSTEAPVEPAWGDMTCGDWNDDGFVNQADVDAFTAFLASNGGPCPLMECWDCPCVGDINPDGVIDEGDLAIIQANFGRCLYDINFDGSVNGADITEMGLSWMLCAGHANFDPAADLNCDSCVDGTDLGLLREFMILGGDHGCTN